MNYKYSNKSPRFIIKQSTVNNFKKKGAFILSKNTYFSTYFIKRLFI